MSWGMRGLGGGMAQKRTATTTLWAVEHLSSGRTLNSRTVLADWCTRHRGAAVTSRLPCLAGVLALLSLGCPKGGDDVDEADEPTYFSAPGGNFFPSKGPPTPLEVLEAQCVWPCDAPGCIKAPGGKICQVRCETDADCPAQSICICE